MQTEPTQPEKPETSPVKEGNISLILDNYEDIFSDFDPRPYAERALSDDFLIECKKMSRDKTKKEGMELRLLMPKNLRNRNEEAKIKKRLKDYFTKNFHEKQKERKKEKRQGATWFLAGVTLITISALLYDYSGFLFNFLVVLLEPAGWFTTWTGLDKLFARMIEKRPDLEFYKKMAKIEIVFHEY